MRVLDYLRLGSAGLKAHKKQTLTVVAIVGLLFGVMIAATLIIQGLENAILAEMLTPTAGKVLLMNSVDTKICGEECNVEAEVRQIKRNVNYYGGQVVKTAVSQTSDGVFYRLEDEVLAAYGDKKLTDDVMQVLVPVATAAKLANISMPGREAKTAEKIQAIKLAQEKTLHQIITSKSGHRYYIAELLPSATYADGLSLASVGQSGNPLDLLIGQISTGVSQDFSLNAVALKTVDQVSHNEPLPDVVVAEEMGAEEMGLVFAIFPSLETAYAYYRDEVNYCSEMDLVFSSCSKNYKYQTMAAISNPLVAYDKLQEAWRIYKVIAIALAIIALMIAVSTYTRIIGKDAKIIALYSAMGATRWQIRAVYLVYLLIMSLLTVVFAAVVGLVLAAGISLINQTALTQVFTLGFGKVAERSVWLIGWNSMIWYLMVAICLSAVITIVLSSRLLRGRNLASKIK